MDQPFFVQVVQPSKGSLQDQGHAILRLVESVAEETAGGDEVTGEQEGWRVVRPGHAEKRGNIRWFETPASQPETNKCETIWSDDTSSNQKDEESIETERKQM